MVALPLYVYKLTESPMHTSLVAVFTGLPYFLFGLFAGAMADRGNRKLMMIGCSLFSGLLLATIPAAAMMGQVSVFHLLAVGLLVSTAFVWFDAASHNMLFQLIGRERLVAANSLLSSTDTIIRIGSPVIAGYIIYQFGPQWAIGIDALCYCVAALLIFSLTGSYRSEPSVTNQSLLRRLAGDIKEGLGFIWSEPLVRSLTVLGFGNSFIGGAVTGLIVVFGVQVLGIAKSAPAMSLLFTCGSLGALAASLILPQLRKRFKPGRITIAGLLINAASLAGVAFGGSLSIVCAFYIIWNLANFLVIVNGITLRQQLTPDHLQGRVHASGRMIAWGGYPFGSLLGGIAATAFGVQAVYIVVALLMTLLFVLALLTPLYRYELDLPGRHNG